MSDMNANQTGADLSPEPPPITIGGGGNRLTPGMKLRPRQATTVEQGVVVSPEDYSPEGYTGQNLVNSKGVIARGQYSEDEAYAELARFPSAAARLNFLNTLQSFGVYGNSKPSSTGFGGQDLSAMREAMLTANALGVTLDVAVGLLAADPTIRKQAAAGRRVRTTPKQDLRMVFKSAALSTLGRQLSDNEVEKFIRAYNQSEVREAMGGEAAASPQVAAQEAVTAAAPDEAAAVGASRLASIMDQMIKGLA
jgi:hypothetical protein